MRETFNFLTMVAWMEPESDTSSRYRVSVGYHGDPEGFMSVPSRKKAERIILDCLCEEAETFADDEPENDDREELASMVKTMKTTNELDLVKSSQAFRRAVSSGPSRANNGTIVHGDL